MKKLLIGVIILILSTGVSFAECTYTAGQIVCTQDTYSDYKKRSGDSCDTGAEGFIIYTDGTRSLYLKWNELKVPKGATISAAKITVYPASGAGGAMTTATLLDYDDIQSLSDCTNLNETATTADYTTTAAWPTAVAGDSSYDITGMEGLVTAWIGRPGYDYLQNIGVKLTGTGATHSIDTYPASPSRAPVLTMNFTGGDPILEVIMAEPHVRIGQYIRCDVYNADPTDKLFIKLDGTPIYEEAIGGSGEQITVDAPADYSGLTAGPHTLDIYITDSGDTEYTSTHYDKDWTTLHDGIPYAGIDINNNYTVNGVPFFPITLYILDVTKFSGYYGDGAPVTDMITMISGIGSGGISDYREISGLKTYLGEVANMGNLYFKGPVWWYNPHYHTRYSPRNIQISETFDTTGAYDETTHWSTSGTVDPDAAYIVGGSGESCEIDGSGGESYLRYTFDGVQCNDQLCGSLWIKFAIKRTSSSGVADIVRFLDGDGTKQASVIWTNDGYFQVTHGSISDTTSTTVRSNDTLYYVWVYFESGGDGGAGGDIRAYVNTSDSKPASADAEDQSTAVGGYFGGIKYVDIVAEASNVIIIDNFQDDIDTLYEYVSDATVKAYTPIIRWTFEDEPDSGGDLDIHDAVSLSEFMDVVHSGDTERPFSVGMYGYNYSDAAGNTSANKTRGNAYMYKWNGGLWVSDGFGWDIYPYHYTCGGQPWVSLTEWIDVIDRVYEGTYNRIPQTTAIAVAQLDDNEGDWNVPYDTLAGGNFTSYSGTNYVYFAGNTAYKAEIVDNRRLDALPFSDYIPYPHPNYNYYLVLNEVGDWDESSIIIENATITECTGTDCGTPTGVTAEVGGDAAKYPAPPYHIGCGNNKDWPNCATSYPFTGQSFTPMATEHMAKHLIYTGIAHGIKGIGGFQYRCGHKQALFHQNTLESVKAHLATFKLPFLSGTTVAVEDTDTADQKTLDCTNQGASEDGSCDGEGRIDLLGKLYENKLYLLAVEVLKNTEEVRFTYGGIEDGATIYRYDTAAATPTVDYTITAGDGYFDDTIGPLEAIIYTTEQVQGVVSGTVIVAGGVNESDIVDGGLTITTTLTNDTWDSTLGLDNAVTDAFIAGFVSNLAEANGWNAVVQVGLAFGDVTLVNPTTVTVLMPPFVTYDISQTEVITFTADATTLTDSDDNIEFSPSFTIGAEAPVAPPSVITIRSTGQNTTGVAIGFNPDGRVGELGP